MKFCAIKCTRPVAVQRAIYSYLAAWEYLDERQQGKTRELVGKICGTPAEGRALYEVLIKGKTPEQAAARTYVPVRRIYKLRAEFYDLWEM